MNSNNGMRKSEQFRRGGQSTVSISENRDSEKSPLFTKNISNNFAHVISYHQDTTWKQPFDLYTPLISAR